MKKNARIATLHFFELGTYAIAYNYCEKRVMRCKTVRKLALIAKN